MSIATEIQRLQTAKADIKTAIEGKGVTVPSTTKLDGYATLIDSIETGGGGGDDYEEAPLKDINFFDYDGKVAYSYTISEFAQLTELPANRPHSGLTGQGWNWTKEQIDEQIEAMPKQMVVVAPYYITSDEKTRLYLEYAVDMNPYFSFGINGSIEIDWGDGSETTTLTGTNVGTRIETRHEYARGNYVMSITVTGSMRFVASTNCPQFTYMWTPPSNNNGQRIAWCALKHIRFGANVSVMANSFYNCRDLKTVTVPSYLSPANGNIFTECHTLKFLALPNWTGTNMISQSDINFATLKGGTATIDASAFSGCTMAKYVTIPHTITSIGNSAFLSCISLREMWFPKGLTSIGSTCFKNNLALSRYHFLSETPPTLGSGSFDSTASGEIIRVPYSEDHSILEAYQTATNWSTYASKIAEEEE